VLGCGSGLVASTAPCRLPVILRPFPPPSAREKKLNWWLAAPLPAARFGLGFGSVLLISKHLLSRNSPGFTRGGVSVSRNHPQFRVVRRWLRTSKVSAEWCSFPKGEPLETRARQSGSHRQPERPRFREPAGCGALGAAACSKPRRLRVSSGARSERKRPPAGRSSG
jgi:hypothetical protein